jgi:hypothetical protein
MVVVSTMETITLQKKVLQQNPENVDQELCSDAEPEFLYQLMECKFIYILQETLHLS